MCKLLFIVVKETTKYSIVIMGKFEVLLILFKKSSKCMHMSTIT